MPGENDKATETAMSDVFIHESSSVDEPVQIGGGTKIWHFCHVMSGAVIGRDCSFGQNCFVSGGVRIGNNVKVQNNVSIYDGVVLEDGVFCGPSMVFTNVINPRSFVDRKQEFRPTRVRQGATIGANATIICGVTIGEYAMVAAGAVISVDVPDFALMMRVPARLVGWVSRNGQRLEFDENGLAVCPATGERYRKSVDDVVTLESEA